MEYTLLLPFQVKSLTELTVHVLLDTGKPILNPVTLLVENLEKIPVWRSGPVGGVTVGGDWR